MAARTVRTTQTDATREKIQVGNLINRVQKFAMGELNDEDISPNRLNAIKLLLSKSLPDLQSIELTGDADKPVVLQTIVRTIVDPQDPDS